MQTVAVSTLRSNLVTFLKQAEIGEEIHVTSRGHEIARILPPQKISKNARKELQKLSKHCYIGDIVSPIDINWEADN